MPIGPVTPQDAGTDFPRACKKISTHWLYLAVVVAVVAGTAVRLIFGRQAAGMAVLFCTIVLGIASVNTVSQVGRVGAIALLSFVVMPTFALALGPGNFLLDTIPTTLFSALTLGSVLQALFVGLVVSFAAQALGQDPEFSQSRARRAAPDG